MSRFLFFVTTQCFRDHPVVSNERLKQYLLAGPASALRPGPIFFNHSVANTLSAVAVSAEADVWPQKKESRRLVKVCGSEKKTGGVLLSHRRVLQDPRRWGPSLPCSEWERVFPPL